MITVFENDREAGRVRDFHCAIVLMLFSLFVTPSGALAIDVEKGSSNSPELARKVDDYSRRTSGIGLIGFSILLESDESSYFLESSFGPHKRQALEELSKAGIVTYREVAFKDGRFLQVIPTALGKRIRLELLGEDANRPPFHPGQ